MRKRKMSVKRRKALRSARGVIKRLEKSSLTTKDVLNLTKLYADLPGLSTQRLQTITRKNLIYWSQDLLKGKNVSFLEMKNDILYTTPGSKEEDIFAKIDVENIIKILEQGSNFTAIRMGNIGAQSAIQSSANRIRNIFEQARAQFTDAEIIEKIKERFGSVKHFEDWLEEMIYIIYNQWDMGVADDPGYYDREIYKLWSLFGALDLGFIS